MESKIDFVDDDFNKDGKSLFPIEEEYESENWKEWFNEDWAINDDWNKIEPVDDYEKLEDEGI
jgi:hypothetical protein